MKHLDLVLERGRTYGLLGPNGSGKTTTMRMILSILYPDSGTIRVLGRDRATDSKSQIGYLPEDRGLYKNMRVYDFLAYVARLRGVPAAGMKGRIETWLDRVDLADKLKAKCGTLSRGQQQRVQALAAMIHEPDLLILDEPFSGLDPVNRRGLAEVIREQRERGCTLVFSTHMMHHAEAICDHIVMMNEGEKVLDASLDETREHAGSSTLICEPLAADHRGISELEGVAQVTEATGHLRVQLDDSCEPHAMIARIAAAVPMRRVEIERLSLEEIFVRTVAAREQS